MTPEIKTPFYAKTAYIFISLFAVVFIMYIGQAIILPLIFAILIATLLNPLVNYLCGKKINKIVSISMAVFLAIMVSLGILYIVSSQAGIFSETYPRLKIKFNESSYRLVSWVSSTFNIRITNIIAWTKETEHSAISNFEFGEKLTAAGRMLMAGMLLPVYVFMILFYKTLLLEFIRRLFSDEHHVAVAEVLVNTKNIIQSYLVGLFLEMLIVAVLNSAGLLILGIDYAIILGITGAIVNIIPYVGGIIAIALPVIIAFVTKDSVTYSLLVLCIYIFIQFIDNHYIIPKIVAARVRINALVSVIVVLIGAAIWGIPGMFISIPLTAILKVIFDHIEPLKPWGFLLGNTVPTASSFTFIRQKK
ncbi:MAG: AI-2E family transporter [Bacteroidia bacterium]